MSETTAVLDAMEDAAAEKLAGEASDEGAESEPGADVENEPGEERPMGGLLPRIGEQAELDGEGFEKPVKTRRQLAEEFLEHFQADVEKAETAVFNARRKLREAQVLRDDAEENLRRAIQAENEGADDAEPAEQAEPDGAGDAPATVREPAA
jgi:hypothetical protein